MHHVAAQPSLSWTDWPGHPVNEVYNFRPTLRSFIMPFFKVTLAYDGARFSGWQWQPTVRTVQGVFERAWREIAGEKVRVSAAGRTDAGVHAQGQVVGVDTATELAPRRLVLGLNAALPDDVVIRSVDPAPEGFHAAHDAKRKRYRYALYNDRRRPLFLRNYVWHIPTPLDAEAMHRCGQELTGKHDFASFQSAGSERESTVRTIFRIEVRRGGAGEGGADDAGLDGPPQVFSAESESLITIDVEGDGFLYNMVRTIAGTLVVIGRGRRSDKWLAEVVAAGNRSAAGQTAPPQGLTLMCVEY